MSKISVKIIPTMTAPFMIAVPGSSRLAAPFAVADAHATCVVTVLVRGAIVVPGIVLAASVVTTVTILILAIVCIAVVSGAMLGGIVVSGTVVVYVISSPSAVTGIALPFLEAAYCVESESVAVSGDEDEP
ncbi:hypothetical protein ABVK25_000840 [Lepraria finkii]|uniref:Uncharacterized protein n=1 Tax=Lepraria finkii TaxID=1340010 RepID=A0ABR4BP13_9LECA